MEILKPMGFTPQPFLQSNVSQRTMDETSRDMRRDVGGYDFFHVSSHVIEYVYTINLGILCGILSIFGITTNVLNILVFSRLGFQETINISLLGLSISDLCSLITLLWVSICYNPYFLYSELPVFSIELQHYPGGWTHVIFTRITGLITVFITLERCLCIAFPLKIKNIMTPKRVTIIIIAIYVCVIATMVQNYFVCYISWKWVPSQNRSMIGISYLDNSDYIEGISQYIQMFYPVTSFSSVVICTGIFVWKLNQRRKWRESATKGQETSSAMRDRQVIKLVVCVAVVFIASYIPSLLLFIALSSLPDMNMGRKYENFYILGYSISFCFEAINSSVNIFVYLKMMSKYRTVFLSMFTSRHKGN